MEQSVGNTADVHQQHNMTRQELLNTHDITFDKKSATTAHQQRRKRGTKSAAVRELQYVNKQQSSDSGTGFRNTVGAFPRMEHFSSKPGSRSHQRGGGSKSITYYRDDNAFRCKYKLNLCNCVLL